MRYWCKEDTQGDGNGYVHGCGYYYGDGYVSGNGYGDGYIPCVLVTGVKLEEVVLNAVLV